MLTTTRRGPGSAALLAIGLLFLLPAMAEAQLFPNQPIKRQRESCATEPPFYAHVRRDYYGYFPTCWSKFPEGWACPCPNPELPNAAVSFRDRPRDDPSKRPAEDPGLGAEPDDRAMPGDPPAPDPDLPPVPDRGRSPFDMDRPGTSGPTRAPDPIPPVRAPNGNATVRPGDNPSVPPASRISPPTTLREMPSLPEVAPSTVQNEPTRESGSMAVVPEATLTSTRPSDRPDLGPLPPTPEVNPGMIGDPERPIVGVPPAVPAQAPQRRSLLGGLFGSGRRRR